MSNCMWPYGVRSTKLLCPWDSPGKNTGVGCCALFQGIFLNQGSNLCHLGLTCTGRRVLYHQCHLGSSRLSLWDGKKKNCSNKWVRLRKNESSTASYKAIPTFGCSLYGSFCELFSYALCSFFFWGIQSVRCLVP